MADDSTSDHTITPRTLISNALNLHSTVHRPSRRERKQEKSTLSAPVRPLDLNSSVRKRERMSMSMIAEKTPHGMVQDFLAGHSTGPVVKKRRISRTPDQTPKVRNANTSLSKKAAVQNLLRHTFINEQTPRTMMQGFLDEAPERTPLVPERQFLSQPVRSVPSPHLPSRRRKSVHDHSFMNLVYASQPSPRRSPRFSQRERVISHPDLATGVEQRLISDRDRSDRSVFGVTHLDSILEDTDEFSMTADLGKTIHYERSASPRRRVVKRTSHRVTSVLGGHHDLDIGNKENTELDEHFEEDLSRLDSTGDGMNRTERRSVHNEQDRSRASESKYDVDDEEVTNEAELEGDRPEDEHKDLHESELQGLQSKPFTKRSHKSMGTSSMPRAVNMRSSRSSLPNMYIEYISPRRRSGNLKSAEQRIEETENNVRRETDDGTHTNVINSGEHKNIARKSLPARQTENFYKSSKDARRSEPLSRKSLSRSFIKESEAASPLETSTLGQSRFSRRSSRQDRSAREVTSVLSDEHVTLQRSRMSKDGRDDPDVSDHNDEVEGDEDEEYEEHSNRSHSRLSDRHSRRYTVSDIIESFVDEDDHARQEIKDDATADTEYDKENQPAVDTKDDEESQPAVDTKDDEENQPAVDTGDDEESRPAVDAEDDEEHQPAVDTGDDEENQSAVDRGDDDESQPAVDAEDDEEHQPAVDTGDNEENQPAVDMEDDEESQPAVDTEYNQQDFNMDDDERSQSAVDIGDDEQDLDDEQGRTAVDTGYDEQGQTAVDTGDDEQGHTISDKHLDRDQGALSASDADDEDDMENQEVGTEDVDVDNEYILNQASQVDHQEMLQDKSAVQAAGYDDDRTAIPDNDDDVNEGRGYYSQEHSDDDVDDDATPAGGKSARHRQSGGEEQEEQEADDEDEDDGYTGQTRRESRMTMENDTMLRMFRNSMGEATPAGYAGIKTPRLPLDGAKGTPPVTITDRTTEQSQPQNQKRPGPRGGATQTRQATGSSGLPLSVTRNILNHFSKKRVPKETVEAVDKIAGKYWKNIVDDLCAYSAHRGQQTIIQDDVVLLLTRQGFINKTRTMEGLIERYIPDHREELIPIARSGNRVELS